MSKRSWPLTSTAKFVWLLFPVDTKTTDKKTIDVDVIKPSFWSVLDYSWAGNMRMKW